MNKKAKVYKAVQFDLDGTILYTLPDIAAAINVPLINRNVEPLSIEEVRLTVGNGLLNSLIGALKMRNVTLSEESQDKALKELMDYYKENPTKYCYPYNNVIELLSKMDIPFGLLSNKEESLVIRIASKIFSGIDFYSVQGMKNKETKKPNPFGILNFSSSSNIPLEDILYIGDSEVDYLTAKNAGCDILLVSWGYRDREYLEKLDAPIVDTIDELWEFIHGNK